MWCERKEKKKRGEKGNRKTTTGKRKEKKEWARKSKRKGVTFIQLIKFISAEQYKQIDSHTVGLMHITRLRMCIRGLILGSTVIVLSRPSWLWGYTAIVLYALSAFHDMLIVAIIARLMHDISYAGNCAVMWMQSTHIIQKDDTMTTVYYVQPFTDIQMLIRLEVFL